MTLLKKASKNFWKNKNLYTFANKSSVIITTL